MFYQLSGDGRPAIVFVHGFTCDHTDWQAQVDALQARHRIVACDLRGHGRTPADPGECSIETYGADVADLIASLDIVPAVLVGHSMGCRVVLEAARTNRHRVAGLVLVDGSGSPPSDADEAEQAMRDKLAAVGFRAYADARFQQMFPGSRRDAERLLARARALPEAIGTALYPRMVRWDAEHLGPTLAAVGLPLMVIQSTAFDAMQQRVALAPGQTSPYLELIRRMAPQARIEIVPGVGHFTQLEAADRVNRLIESFMTGIA